MTGTTTTMRRLGDYIRQVDVRNRDLEVTNLVGLRPHSTNNVKHRGGGFSKEFRAALREQWGSIVTEKQCEIHRKDAEATVTLTFVDAVGT